jgi:hypothetical protein
MDERLTRATNAALAELQRQKEAVRHELNPLCAFGKPDRLWIGGHVDFVAIVRAAVEATAPTARADVGTDVGGPLPTMWDVKGILRE